MKKKILILNGSPNAAGGNCGAWIKLIKARLRARASVHSVDLASKGWNSSLRSQLSEADGIIFVTGTYWDSWGSPLQKFLEDMTSMEGHSSILGKPAAVFVLMHSVGGKGVLSRLQGVLSTFGFLIPPMSGMVYSLVSEIALRTKSSFAKDFWQQDDADLILENLLVATQLEVTWKTWPVDSKNPKRKWLKA